MATRSGAKFKEEEAAGEARVTGEERGGVKKTAVKGAAERLTEQAKQAAQARQQSLKERRQIHTPKAGSKSADNTPLGKGTPSKVTVESFPQLSPRNLDEEWVCKNKLLAVRALLPKTLQRL